MNEALRDVAECWRRYWPEADIGAIAADVTTRLAAACEAWELRDPRPLRGGAAALTCTAGDVVVKVLPRLHPEADALRGEGRALAFWRSTGAAVTLIDERDDGMTLLLERLSPGDTLDEAVADYDEQLRQVGRLVRHLHAAGEPPPGFPSIEQYVLPFRSIAEPELSELLTTTDRLVAVHADLHGGNVLRSGDGWVAIDPKGARGDPHLDIWLLVCPQAPPLPRDPQAARSEARRRVELYANAAGLDPERAAAWARLVAHAESVLSAQSAYDEWPLRLRRLADALR